MEMEGTLAPDRNLAGRCSGKAKRAQRTHEQLEQIVNHYM